VVVVAALIPLTNLLELQALPEDLAQVGKLRCLARLSYCY
jgi:hypothetical protein